MESCEFMTAKEKEKVLKQWERFVKKDFKWEHFTKVLYNHLHLNCSFIAHYDKHGFYATYFDNSEDTLQFIEQFVTGTSVEYNATWWLHGDYADINEAMCTVMKKYEDSLIRKLNGETIDTLNTEIAQLEAKREEFMAKPRQVTFTQEGLI